ncbi:hypothetical protein GCM10010869_16450 [Mesorhizobium tianshanense]|uniref:P4 family phage/plasmid primase-like protein n=1 Tax=Mesorhizobium tianshanense TaxID=39844 RepID=A0A562NW05_9HYPH|nr:phage/plasmid primase, P4 family [Mesorhizobium tianshanense]TWI36404.1 P4 family phage/plasmid primase-like protein [Mesorhizobium tianshanense]GLS36056.1 hypothetical protein GCM10010869_16450 [Mesorhizobium tianshanense]
MDARTAQNIHVTVRTLADFFVGYSTAHGHSEPTGKHREDGKAIAKSWTDKTPLAQHDWDDHLAGKIGVGIHILLDDDVNIRFGVIDVDQYKIDLKDLSEKIADLPLTLFRSKSGGAHLHCSIAVPRPAAAMQKLLNGLAAHLGFTGCEIFPKQTIREADDFGSWINIPYFAGDRSTRYAIVNRRGLPLDEAIDHLAMKQLSGDEFDEAVAQFGADAPPTQPAEPKTVIHLTRHETAPKTTIAEGQAFAAERLQSYIKELRQVVKGDRNNKLNERAFWLGQMAGRGWIDEDDAKNSLRDAIRGFWNLDRDDWRRMYRTIISGIKRGKLVPHPEISKILDPSDPLTIAKKLVAGSMTDEAGDRLMQRHKGAFYQFRNNFYRQVNDEEIRNRVWRYLGRAQCWDAKANKALPFKPNKHIVANVCEALQSVCMVADRDPPFWIKEQDDQPPPNELFICANGLLHLSTKRLLPVTPNFFCLSGSDVRYDEKATCPEWTAFLNSIWSDDPYSSTALKEWFGYFLSQDTKLQKVLLVIGPKRGGKGTIGRVAKALLGAESVIGPTLHSFGTQYGPQELIGKSLAVISDARITNKSDASAITEMLLAVSGEDPRTLPRKYLSAWTGRLTVRFMILATEIPSLPDESGGLPNRFIVLPLTESFLGREDHDLERRLMGELPGILNWAVEGYATLSKRGRFEQPKSGTESIADMERIAEPVATWATENLRFETLEEREERLARPKLERQSNESEIDFATRMASYGYGEPFETLQALFANWNQWCEDTGRKAGSDASFAKKLRAVFPKLRSERMKNDKGKPVTAYLGVKLLDFSPI